MSRTLLSSSDCASIDSPALSTRLRRAGSTSSQTVLATQERRLPSRPGRTAPPGAAGQSASDSIWCKSTTLLCIFLLSTAVSEIRSCFSTLPIKVTRPVPAETTRPGLTLRTPSAHRPIVLIIRWRLPGSWEEVAGQASKLANPAGEGRAARVLRPRPKGGGDHHRQPVQERVHLRGAGPEGPAGSSRGAGCRGYEGGLTCEIFQCPPATK